MDWVHCNTCYITPLLSSDKCFFLTSCGHIICSVCKKREQKGRCCTCRKTCNFVELKKPLPPQVDIWMNDPINSIIKIKNVVKFQDLNRKKMLSGALKKAEVRLIRIEEKFQAVLQENQRLKAVLSQLQSDQCTGIPSSHNDMVLIYL